MPINAESFPPMRTLKGAINVAVPPPDAGNDAEPRAELEVEDDELELEGALAYPLVSHDPAEPRPHPHRHLPAAGLSR